MFFSNHRFHSKISILIVINSENGVHEVIHFQELDWNAVWPKSFVSPPDYNHMVLLKNLISKWLKRWPWIFEIFWYHLPQEFINQWAIFSDNFFCSPLYFIVETWRWKMKCLGIFVMLKIQHICILSINVLKYSWATWNYLWKWSLVTNAVLLDS